MFAAMKNFDPDTITNPEVITALIKGGANINAKDKNGLSPLMYAALSNTNPEVITTLLNHRADAKIKDNSGKTAVDYARANADLVNTNALKKLEEASR
jgi:ankyrin repeat protein